MGGLVRNEGLTLVEIAFLAVHCNDIADRENRTVRRRAAPSRLVTLSRLLQRAEDTPSLLQLREFLLEFRARIAAFADGGNLRFTACAADLGSAVLPQAGPEGGQPWAWISCRHAGLCTRSRPGWVCAMPGAHA